MQNYQLLRSINNRQKPLHGQVVCPSFAQRNEADHFKEQPLEADHLHRPGFSSQVLVEEVRGNTVEEQGTSLCSKLLPSLRVSECYSSGIRSLTE